MPVGYLLPRADMRAHILVVEPELALQAALSNWLEWEGYDCACASDPDEALASAEHERTDVALVAERAGAWDGRRLAEALRERQADLAIILHGGVADRRAPRARGLDMLDAVPAPLTRGAVTWAVIRAVRWREAAAADRFACLALEHAMFQQAEDLRDACRSIRAGGGLTPLESIAARLDARTPGATAHARRVADIARALGAVVNLPVRAMAALERAAFLHDMGKAALPDALLRKPTPLTDLEIALLRQHPRIAHDVMVDTPGLDEAAPLVLAAQERFDGGGYPSGLAALEIPMGARIIALADAIDLLTHDQPLGLALSLPEACAELVRGAGQQFDPDLVRVWLRLAEASVAVQDAVRESGAAAARVRVHRAG
jgi:response regulator RpfG family c-di-GMP phosphodiesterase